MYAVALHDLRGPEEGQRAVEAVRIDPVLPRAALPFRRFSPRSRIEHIKERDEPAREGIGASKRMTLRYPAEPAVPREPCWASRSARSVPSCLLLG